MTKAEIKRNKRIAKLLLEIDEFLAEVAIVQLKRLANEAKPGWRGLL